jgi:hypothetical protein
MGLRLPAFAKPIAEARAAGKRPAQLVIVSDGEHALHRRFPNPVVRLGADERPDAFDWSFLADLDVEIATRGDVRRINAMVSAILRVMPWYLRVWRIDTNSLTRIRWLGVTHICRETLCS